MGPLNEFRDMVKALHRADIDVILDVVFNHTAEDDETGPTFSLRGIDNFSYYLLDSLHPGTYLNNTGTGNTINANHSVVRRMIKDSLKYWVEEMHVDGFRFDLASVLSRGEDGHPMENPPLLWSIDSDPELVHTKIIAEAWDAAGLYQVGCFVGDRWAVMNGHFRDVVRRFIKGDKGLSHELGDVITGSARLFRGSRKDAQRSVNFVTAHDGFTLNDLVSYNHKHNDENGEEGRDGTDANYSYNYGIEGPTNDPVVESLRKQHIKNFLAILLLSQGPPLISMGDEMRRSVNGNNNPYALDTAANWLNWKLLDTHTEIFRFIKELIKKRKRSYIFMDKHIWSLPGGTDVIWHGIKTNSPDWSENSHSVAMELYQEGKEERYFAIINAYHEALEFELPETGVHYTWAMAFDTANEPPEDIVDSLEQVAYKKKSYRSRPHSVAVLRTIRK
jgi:glycogen operon protein